MSGQDEHGYMLGRHPMATANDLSFSLAGPPAAPPPYIVVGGSYAMLMLTIRISILVITGLRLRRYRAFPSHFHGSYVQV